MSIQLSASESSGADTSFAAHVDQKLGSVTTCSPTFDSVSGRSNYAELDSHSFPNAKTLRRADADDLLQQSDVTTWPASQHGRHGLQSFADVAACNCFRGDPCKFEISCFCLSISASHEVAAIAKRHGFAAHERAQLMLGVGREHGNPPPQPADLEAMGSSPRQNEERMKWLIKEGHVRPDRKPSDPAVRQAPTHRPGGKRPRGHTAASTATSSTAHGRTRETHREHWWFYIDTAGERQGPFTADCMRAWYEQGYFVPTTLCACASDGEAPGWPRPISRLWLRPEADAFRS